MLIAGAVLALFVATGAHAQESHRMLQDQENRDEVFAPAATIQGHRSESAPIGAHSATAHEVYGFHPYWVSGAEADYRWSALSTLVFFKIEVTFDGYLNTSNPNYQPPTSLLNLAHANGVRVEYAFTSTDVSANNALLSSKTYYTRAADNIVAKVVADGADGVNVDLEMIDGSNRAALTDFVRILSEKMHAALPGSTVSVDIPAIDWDNAFDVAALSTYADRLIMMGYDYWGCWSDTAGPSAPLYSTSWRANYSVFDSLQTYLGLMAEQKLVLGVPWYGNSWLTSGNSVPKSVSPNCSGGGSWLGSIQVDEAEQEAALHNKNWYSQALVPYTTAAAGQTFQTWYDDAQSLQEKYNLAEAEDLAGVAIWALGYEDGDQAIWDGLSAYAQGVPDSLERLFGSNRYETAIAISQRLYPAPDSAQAVVLATGQNWPDALGGSVLAKKVDGPLLLTDSDDITPSTATEIDRVLPAGGSVYVLGGPSAVAEEVINDLTGLGFTVVRYAGADRYQTAATIATVVDGSPTSAFIGTGANFPDILSAAAPATQRGEPILLTNVDSLPQATLDFLNGTFGANLSTVYVAGGTAVVSDSVVQQLQQQGLNVVRLSGPDRYATSKSIAEHFYTSPTKVSLATGETFADGLAGAVMSATSGAPVLLVQPENLPQPIWEYLEQRAGSLVEGFIYGGTAAVSRAVQNVAQTLIAP